MFFVGVSRKFINKHLTHEYIHTQKLPDFRVYCLHILLESPVESVEYFCNTFHCQVN